MPFGLKNVGATYQRVRNKMFAHQIGRNVQVYVDDMLIKSQWEDNYLDYLKETFDTLRFYNMKLNPNKCTFRVMVEQDTGHNGDDAMKEHQGSTKPQRQSSCPKQVRLKSNGQMPTFLLHIEEVLQVDGQMSTSIRRLESIPFFPTIAESL